MNYNGKYVCVTTLTVPGIFENHSQSIIASGFIYFQHMVFVIFVPSSFIVKILRVFFILALPFTNRLRSEIKVIL